ncbi:MAG: bifunctional diaminohydroxyphosphoribosylaminopyrimidine deaminase/5-amino-6-(5-phosphoribosylamino)uracil reductase RibD [Desulforegulaceae bacterium]|nr:bifunctional diaminohydroxyphosphoribosylaminopyrimidine deaminase/5-amino-6-(5-phosphoribosylamino)uracil reductase RibD [Desulforegulaceae bacterium]
MFDKKDIEYMNLALELASRGRGFTKTNPMVGAVCVKNGDIIGQGFHEEYGKAHAEVNALDQAGKNAEGSTLYVTLEPCSHYGKTPPCTEKILKSRVKKVVTAIEDPNPKVSGSGNAFLRQNNVEVLNGLLQEKARALNLPFIKFITEKTPYTVLKLAMTLDGRIATKTGDSKWITNEKSRRWSHFLRHQCQAVLVGRNTVEADNPSLNTRIKEIKSSDPLKIVTDSNLKLDPESGLKIFSDEMKKNTLFACVEDCDPLRIKKFNDFGVEVIKVKKDKNSHVCLSSLLIELGKRKISSLMVEGGSMIAGSFLNNNLVDQIAFFYGSKIIGCSKSFEGISGNGPEKMSDAIKVQNTKLSKFDDDILIEGRTDSKSGVYKNLLWPVFYFD